MTAGSAPESSAYRYWAFVSHSSHDAAQAAWLHRAIERYGIPARLVRGHVTPAGEPAPVRFCPIYRDRREPPASPGPDPATGDALRASRYLIVVCSPGAAASPRVNQEVETFAGWGRGDRILAYVVAGEPNCGDERECFAPALRGREPLAADARREGDGRNDARLKLLAGMLGVGYDALRQREAQRRLRRLRRVMAAALALVLLFAGLAGYANGQRVKAVRARDEAESVLEFLTTDLRAALEPVGRPDIIRDIQQRVDEYFGRLQADTGRYQALHDRAQAALTAGLEAWQRGDLDQALLQYQAGLQISEQMVAMDAANRTGQSDLAQSQHLLAGVLSTQGRLDESLAAHRAALVIYQQMAGADPTDLNRRLDLAQSHQSICLVLSSLGKQDEALAACRSSLETAQGLVLADPGDADLQYALAKSHLYLAGLLQAQGYPLDAMGEHRAGLEIMGGLVAADGSNIEWQYALRLAHNGVGNVLESQGYIAEALAEYRAGLAIAEEQSRSPAAGADWQYGLWVSHFLVARVLEQIGDPAAVDHWQRTYDTLSAIRQAGLYFSPEEQQVYEQLRQKLGR